MGIGTWNFSRDSETGGDWRRGTGDGWERSPLLGMDIVLFSKVLVPLEFPDWTRLLSGGAIVFRGVYDD